MKKTHPTTIENTLVQLCFGKDTPQNMLKQNIGFTCVWTYTPRNHWKHIGLCLKKHTPKPLNKNTFNCVYKRHTPKHVKNALVSFVFEKYTPRNHWTKTTVLLSLQKTDPETCKKCCFNWVLEKTHPKTLQNKHWFYLCLKKNKNTQELLNKYSFCPETIENNGFTVFSTSKKIEILG